MIRSRLGILLAEKANQEGRKIPYRIVTAETGISNGALVRLNDGGHVARIDGDTLQRLCIYFGCTVGDILEYVADSAPEVAA